MSHPKRPKKVNIKIFLIFFPVLFEAHMLINYVHLIFEFIQVFQIL